MIKIIGTGRWGQLATDDRIENGAKAKVVRSFLEHTVIRMTKRSFDFWKRYNKEDYPLRYDERRMLSLVSAAVDQITPCHLTEYAVSRGPGTNRNAALQAEPVGQTGRVDLWCLYGGVDFLLEFKRAYISPGYTGERTGLAATWQKLNDQISGIEGDIRQWSDSYIRLGLMTVLVIQTGRTEKKFSNKAVEDILSEVRGSLNGARRVAWCAAWAPPAGPMILREEREDGSVHVESVPTVLFFARLFRKELSND